MDVFTNHCDKDDLCEGAERKAVSNTCCTAPFKERPSSLCAHACTASQGAFKLLRRPHDTLCKYV